MMFFQALYSEMMVNCKNTNKTDDLIEFFIKLFQKKLFCVSNGKRENKFYKQKPKLSENLIFKQLTNKVQN